MFDVVAKQEGSYPLRVFNFEVKLKVSSCDYQIYTSTEWSYYGYNDPSSWSMISSGTLTQGSPYTDTHFSGFTPQIINPGENRAFFIAFMDCSGSWPLSVEQGSDYMLGTLVEDDNLELREGIKFGSPLSKTNPFGMPNEPYCECYCCAGGISTPLWVSYISFPVSFYSSILLLSWLGIFTQVCAWFTLSDT